MNRDLDFEPIRDSVEHLPESRIYDKKRICRVCQSFKLKGKKGIVNSQTSNWFYRSNRPYFGILRPIT